MITQFHCYIKQTSQMSLSSPAAVFQDRVNAVPYIIDVKKVAFVRILGAL